MATRAVHPAPGFGATTILQPMRVDVASGQTLPLKATQLTTRMSLFDSLTYEETIWTSKFLDSPEQGSTVEFAYEMPWRGIFMFSFKLPLKMQCLFWLLSTLISKVRLMSGGGICRHPWYAEHGVLRVMVVSEYFLSTLSLSYFRKEHLGGCCAASFAEQSQRLCVCTAHNTEFRGVRVAWLY